MSQNSIFKSRFLIVVPLPVGITSLSALPLVSRPRGVEMSESHIYKRIAYLFEPVHIGHAYRGKVGTECVRLRKASDDFGEPVDVGAQALFVS
jgi:hypothetical protein